MKEKGKSRYALNAAEVKEKFGIDVITAEVIRNALWQLTRQMHVSLMRSAFSGVIRDMMDMGVSIHLIMPDGHCEEVAVTEGCCQFAFCHMLTTNTVLKEYGIENLRDGDILITNDPYRGAIHPSDLNLTGVTFWEGKPEFALASGAHFMDMGGPIPGGFNMAAQTIYEETLRLPPMLIYADGVPVGSTFNLILENTRLPGTGLGDLRALCGCLRVADVLLKNLIKAYGLETVKAGALYAVDLCERRMRKSISETPDGAYDAEAWIDDDGIERDKPLKVKCKVIIKGDNLEADFSGSAIQPLGPCKTGAVDGVRIGIPIKLVLEPDFQQITSGTMHPVDAIMPPGSLLAPYPPASVCNHVDLGAKVNNVITTALSKARPDRGIAPDLGNCAILAFGGDDTRPGKGGMPFGFVLIPGGSWGGTYKKDGCSGLILGIGNMRSCIVEYVEQENPVMILSANEYLDEGGVGKFKSGNSWCMKVHALSDFYVTSINDASRFCPQGVNGGGDGTPTVVYMANEPFPPCKAGIVPMKYLTPLFGTFDEKGRPDFENGKWAQGALEPSGHFSGRLMKAGDTIMFYNSTGAGYGDPLERDIERVRLDCWNGRLTTGFVKRAYGVIISPDTLEVDEEATNKERETLRKKREHGDWTPPVGQFKPWPLKNIEEIKGELKWE